MREGNPSVKAALPRHPRLPAPGALRPQQGRAVGQAGPQRGGMMALSHSCAPFGQKAHSFGCGCWAAAGRLCTGHRQPGVLRCHAPAWHCRTLSMLPTFGSQEREIGTFSGQENSVRVTPSPWRAVFFSRSSAGCSHLLLFSHCPWFGFAGFLAILISCLQILLVI